MGSEKQKRVDICIRWIMFTASICGMGLVSALFPIEGNVPLIVVPSILVLLFSKPVFFEKLKLTTLVTMRILIVVVALNLFNKQLYVNIILIMLMVNILEATLTDILRYKKYLNGISGLVLTVAVCALSGTWSYDAAVGNFYIVGGAGLAASLCYIVAYTIWNWIFVTNEFSSSVALMHVGFLLAPIIGCVTTLWMGHAAGFGMWLLLRANTLAIGGWMQIAAKSWFEQQFYSPNFEKFVGWTKKSSVQVVFMLINLVLLGYCIFASVSAGTFAFPSLFI